MKLFKLQRLFCLVILAILMLWPLRPAQASLNLDLPYGVGSVQLPFDAVEVLAGYVRPVKQDRSLSQVIGGASLPVLTLGKLKDGERLFDGSLGYCGTGPTSGHSGSLYVGFGHDFAQDIQILEQFKTVHLNGVATYLTNFGGWYYGASLSWAILK